MLPEHVSLLVAPPSRALLDYKTPVQDPVLCVSDFNLTRMPSQKTVLGITHHSPWAVSSLAPSVKACASSGAVTSSFHIGLRDSGVLALSYQPRPSCTYYSYWQNYLIDNAFVSLDQLNFTSLFTSSKERQEKKANFDFIQSRFTQKLHITYQPPSPSTTTHHHLHTA